MKLVIYLLAICLASSSFAQTEKKLHVITHERTTITTDPSQGRNPYPAWGVFPETESIRKIVMHVTLGTPDSLPTAHWDYRDHINILRKGGSQGAKLNYELGRMLTPYGSIYGKGWEFKWSVDVTDFALLLKDSVEIEYVHTGYEPKTVGWALTIDFEITPGTPHIIPLSIQPMWRGSYSYGNPEKPFEEELTPLQYEAKEGSVINRLRIQHTGHGMDQPKGCSEFCSRWRQVKFNGEVVHDKDLWKNCGDNPLYPQGGTWIFDRALWCPGDLQQPDIIDVKAMPGTNTFGIEMEPYIAEANIQAKEDITACLIQYAAPTNSNDVAIESIITPNSRPLYTRSNPKCFNPVIQIKNLGSKNLKSLTISYGTDGFSRKKYKWNGDLAFNELEEIILPGDIEFRGTENEFIVECIKPNGKKDGWKGDNTLSSNFHSPKELPQEFIVTYKTNKKPEENNLFIINSLGDTIYHRKAESLLADTVYTDTLRLKKAAYEMSLTDSAGNGLEFWFMKNQGYGYIRLFDMEGRLIHKFESDCGDGEMLAFNTTPDFTMDTTIALYDFILFPKIILDSFSLDVYTEKQEDMEVIFLSNGIPVEKHTYPETDGGKFKYDISHLPDGRYIVEVLMNGERKYKGRINKNKQWN